MRLRSEIPPPYNTTQKRSLPFLQYLACLIFMVLCWQSFFMPRHAHATIQKTARVELHDKAQKFPVGPHTYLMIDKEKKLTADIVTARHDNNMRGVLQNASIINIGLNESSAWLVFSVTNLSQESEWILDFGHVMDGRYVQIAKMMVINATTGQVITDAMREKNTPAGFGKDFNGSALPLVIRPEQTETILINLTIEGSMPATIAPYLITKDNYYRSLRFGPLSTNIIYGFFIFACGVFLAVSFLRQDISFVDFAGYFFFNGILFLVLDQVFFVPFLLVGEGIVALFALVMLAGLLLGKSFLSLTAEYFSENALLIGAAVIVVAGTLLNTVFFNQDSTWDNIFVFIPAITTYITLIILSFSQAKSGRRYGYSFGLSWCVMLFAVIVMALNAADILPQTKIFYGIYWVALLGQAGLFLHAAQQKIREQDFYKRQIESRESRAARSVARLQHSKESADQARLLRVIERERELMAELREREIQRTEEMRRAKIMADEANRAKSAFLAVVSHEIRTPMTGLLGMVRLLIDTKLSKQQFEFAEAIKNSGETMMALLNDILDFEKIERGGLEMEEIQFDLHKLIAGIVTLMSGHAANKNVSLKSEIGENIPRFIIGDPTRLRQVLLNLVNNAIKFTEIGGVILSVESVSPDSEEIPQINNKHSSVMETAQKCCLRFAVIDTGIGISEDAQKKLFEPFAQANKAITRKYGGTGLGLAICWRLIKAMGSEIKIRSATGEGSSFYFILSMPAANQNANDADSRSPYTSKQNPAQEREKIPSMRILVVEDNEINRRVIEAFLTQDRHKPVIVESAEDALKVLDTDTNFDVIFTDVNLQGEIDGMMFSKIVRARDDTSSRLPIFAITGNITANDEQLYRNAGMNGLIAKPIIPERLYAVLLSIHNKEIDVQIPAQKEKSDTQNMGDKQTVSDEISFDADEKETQNKDKDISPLEASIKNMSADTPPVALLDESMFKALLDSLGREKFNELITGFMDASDAMVATLASERDTKTLLARAHELKGMAGNFGFSGLAKQAELIEQAIKNNDDKSLMIYIKALETIFIESKNLFQQYK